MTTFLSKAREQVAQELADRGIRLSAEDLALALEELSPKGSRSALGLVTDFLRSFTAGMGLRTARLSDTQIEVVLPAREKNMREGAFHEGALITASLEAARLLWMRHAPLGRFEIEMMGVNFELHRNVGQDVRLRTELAEIQREAVLSALRQGREATAEMDVHATDDGGQRVADLRVRLRMTLTPALASPEV